MPFAQSAVLAQLLAAPASASPESATFVTLLDGKPAGKEVVTRSAGEKGPILRSRTELSLPGGISLTFDQEASLAPDGFGVVARRLDRRSPPLRFRATGVMKAVGRKFDRWVDVVIMQRALGPGSSAPPG